MRYLSASFHRGWILKISSSRFNYWAGYVANLSLVLWLCAQAFTGLTSQLSLLEWMGYSMSGIFLWTFFEYVLHRWLYHVIPSPASIGHDLHHEKPKDLIGVPWYLTTIVLVTLYYGLATIFHPGVTGVVLAFIWLGYIGYCFMHHSIHHFKSQNKYFIRMKRHHLVHHAQEGKNIGIVTDIWDYIFRTKI